MNFLNLTLPPEVGSVIQDVVTEEEEVATAGAAIDGFDTIQNQVSEVAFREKLVALADRLQRWSEANAGFQDRRLTIADGSTRRVIDLTADVSHGTLVEALSHLLLQDSASEVQRNSPVWRDDLSA